jgi:hypothetical protein
MKQKQLVLVLMLCLIGGGVWAQSDKQPVRRNVVVRQWKVKSGKQTRQLDPQSTFDSLGRKVEEIEYASYGQKERIVTEYEGSSKRISREVVYDDKDKVRRIRKYEYNPNGTKKKQYNYKPDGKLSSTKEYEYSYK